ncbi:hypothetical protein Tco_0026070, partial [Tanacetum coccineum]
ILIIFINTNAPAKATKPHMLMQIHEEDICDCLVTSLKKVEDQDMVKDQQVVSEQVVSTKTAQAKEIASLKMRVKKLERKRKSKTPGMKRLFKIGRSAQVVSSEDEGLGDQEDASKQGRKIDDIDQDVEVTLVDETQGSEKVVKEIVSTAKVSTAATITTEEITLAQALAALKSAKPKVDKVVSQKLEQGTTKPTATPTTATTKGILLQEPSETRTTTRTTTKTTTTPITSSKDKDKVETDYELAQRLQAEEQEELTIKEKSKLFQQLLKKKRKHFAAKRAEERKNKPPTKAQQRSIMTTYLKNMARWKPKDFKNKSFASVQELFENAMKRVNTFVDMDTELVEGSDIREEESSSKRASDELEQEPTKKQKVDDDKEREDLQQCFELVTKEDVAIDVIPLTTKPAPIVGFQIHRKGRNGYYEIMRANGSAKTYLLFSQLLKEFDREDLENLWKLVKAKHGNTRPEEGYERVLWGDLKTMFEHHIEDEVWRSLQGKKVLLWRLYDSCGVHFVRFEDMHIYMLVEKRYPLTPATITDMLNKKLKSDY